MYCLEFIRRYIVLYIYIPKKRNNCFTNALNSITIWTKKGTICFIDLIIDFQTLICFTTFYISPSYFSTKQINTCLVESLNREGLCTSIYKKNDMNSRLIFFERTLRFLVLRAATVFFLN